MSFEPKKIEDLDPAENLQDNDLMFASVLGVDDTYVSKKVTLASIAEYVRNAIGETTTAIDRPLIFDTSTEAVNSDDYVWVYNKTHLREDNSAEVLDDIDRVFNRDCLFIMCVWRVPVAVEENQNNQNFELYLDGHKLSPKGLVDDPSQQRLHFFIKKGQRLEFRNTGIPSPGYCTPSNTLICTLPIKSGGIFFDTSAPDDAFIMDQQYPENRTITVSRKSLVTSYLAGTSSRFTFADPDFVKLTIDGTKVVTYDGTENSGYMARYYLEANQTICFETPPYHQSQVSDNGYCVFPILDSESGSSSDSEGSVYEIYDLPDSDNYINGQTVGNDGFTKTFTRDCEILVTPSTVPTEQGSYGNITVKVDRVQLCTGLFALGIGNLAQFYVKAGQTLSIAGNSGSTIKVYSRPLKSGGNFFIDGTEVLNSPFTGVGRFTAATATDTFEFTAPQKTLFIYAEPTGLGMYLNSVKINGVEINWKNANNSYNYDKLILDINDKITITINSSGHYMTYCALPLLEV